MIERLKQFDADFVLFFNGMHTPFLDAFFFTISKVFVWVPLYLVLFYLVVRTYKNQCWLVMLSIALLITISDQFASGLVKEWVMRYRPSHNLFLENQLHFVNDYKGGLYGFISSHAANVFALTTFLTLIFRKANFKWLWLMWPWALIVSFSRIYLGVHYLSDVVAGIIAGIFFGWVVSKIFLILHERLVSRKSRITI